MTTLQLLLLQGSDPTTTMTMTLQLLQESRSTTTWAHTTMNV